MKNFDFLVCLVDLNLLLRERTLLLFLVAVESKSGEISLKLFLYFHHLLELSSGVYLVFLERLKLYKFVQSL
jgi:hypothetical protein